MSDDQSNRDLRKEQRERGKTARQNRQTEGQTRAQSRSIFVPEDDTSWRAYEEQRYAFDDMAQQAASDAIASEAARKAAAAAQKQAAAQAATRTRQTPSAQTGARTSSSRGRGAGTTSRSTGYTGAVDTEIPVGVLAPEHLDTGGIDYMDPPWNESSDTPGAAGVSEPTRGTAAAEVEGGPAGKHYEGVSGGLSMARDEFNKAYSQAVERAGLTAQELPPHHDVFKKTAWQMVKDSEQLGETVYLPDTGAWLQDLVAAGYGEFADAFEVEIQAVKAHEAEK